MKQNDTPEEQPLGMYAEDERIEAEAQQATRHQSIDERLVAAIELLAAQQEAGPVKQIPLAKAKFCTPWNPTGKRYREELRRPTYLNGHRLRSMMLSEDEIQLLNQLTPGRYHDNRWTVIERHQDDEGTAIQVYIPNRTLQQRLEWKSAAKDLTDALRQIVAEAQRQALAA